MKKISIILPVYNTGAYLRQCLDSLVNQTIQDIEIIAIDDNSTDNSMNILKDYQNIYEDKIKIIANEYNLGAGASRNKGLEQASGEYISFIDSDDYIEKDMMETLYNQACKNNFPDIVRCGYRPFWGIINVAWLTTKRTINEDGIIIPKQQKEYIYTESPGSCNKIMRKDLIDQTRFPEKVKWEDYPFTTFLLGKSSRVLFLNDIKYHYRFNLNGTTINDILRPQKRMLDIFTVADILEQNYRGINLYDEYQKEIRASQIMNCLQRLRDVNFSLKISGNDRRLLTNALLNLIELKYGDWQNQPAYINQKNIDRFYRYRMEYIEKTISDEKIRQENSEEIIKQKIKTIMKKYD